MDQTIHVAGGINNPEKKAISFDGSQVKLKEKENIPIPIGGTKLQYKSPCQLYSIGEEEEYYFRGNDVWNPGMKTLSLRNYTSNEVQAEGLPKNFTVLQKWKIVPLEDFEIMEITYNMVSGDKFQYTLSSIDETEYYNNNPTTDHHTHVYVLEKTTQSTFSETKKLTTTVKSSVNFKTGIPIIAEEKINFEYTTSSEFSWSKGRTETVRESITKTHTFEIPPYSKVIRRKLEYTYNVDITYYAKVKGVQTGTIMYLPGRWKGVIVDATKYETITTAL